MCGEHGSSSKIGDRWQWAKEDTPPDWKSITLPPDHVLKHLTDAHCHPTDLDIASDDYNAVKLGGICSMATVPEDQGKVYELGSGRPWGSPEPGPGPSTARPGPRVVSALGYHPWFTHRYTMLETPPSTSDHYRSIFFPNSKVPNDKHASILESLLPYLPDPLPFGPMLESLAGDIKRSKEESRITMLGEVGLDGGARMKWPSSARHLYEEKYPTSEDEGEGEWNRLTPFKVSMEHQRAIVEAQLGVAVEQGVNVSFHSVAAPGPTMDVLRAMRDKYGWRFTHGIKVDIHSAGGWSPQFWKQAEKQFPNLYASPSILITGRSQSAPDLIRAISPDRILVESDIHDVRLTSKLVWAATNWIAGCRGWKVEDGQEEWVLDVEDVGTDDERGENSKMAKSEEVWAVRTLERNLATFLGLVGDATP